jgi:hypothetical protein
MVLRHPGVGKGPISSKEVKMEHRIRARTVELCVYCGCALQLRRGANCVRPSVAQGKDGADGPGVL